MTLPTLIYQVRRDTLTPPEMVQAIFDNVAAEKKRLFWVEDTERRFDGCLHFQRHPDEVLAWFAAHIG